MRKLQDLEPDRAAEGQTVAAVVILALRNRLWPR